MHFSVSIMNIMCTVWALLSLTYLSLCVFQDKDYLYRHNMENMHLIHIYTYTLQSMFNCAWERLITRNIAGEVFNPLEEEIPVVNFQLSP